MTELHESLDDLVGDRVKQGQGSPKYEHHKDEEVYRKNDVNEDEDKDHSRHDSHEHNSKDETIERKNSNEIIPKAEYEKQRSHDKDGGYRILSGEDVASNEAKDGGKSKDKKGYRGFSYI